MSMDRNPNENEKLIDAGQMDYAAAQENAMQVVNTAENLIRTAGENNLQAGGKSDGDSPQGGANAFSGLPIESLICGPIIAAAKGQQELTAVYIDTVRKLAYGGDGSGKDNKAQTLDFTLQRPVIQESGAMTTQNVKISAPLISLVPVPAFTMDELTVDFNMEVKTMDMTDDKTHSDVNSTVSFNSWFGLKSSITGNVSSDTEHKRQTDSTSTYTIHARAVQQSPTEGMQKLTSLFTSLMEPIDLRGSST